MRSERENGTLADLLAGYIPYPDMPGEEGPGFHQPFRKEFFGMGWTKLARDLSVCQESAGIYSASREARFCREIPGLGEDGSPAWRPSYL
jgi:hypothetical protein